MKQVDLTKLPGVILSLIGLLVLFLAGVGFERKSDHERDIERIERKLGCARVFHETRRPVAAEHDQKTVGTAERDTRCCCSTRRNGMLPIEECAAEQRDTPPLRSRLTVVARSESRDIPRTAA
jgi:hypothetical protein